MPLSRAVSNHFFYDHLDNLCGLIRLPDGFVATIALALVRFDSFDNSQTVALFSIP
jgi:hypothetical protein